MKVELIIDPSETNFEQKLNEFISDKNVVDIKFTATFVPDTTNITHSALVMYED